MLLLQKFYEKTKAIKSALNCLSEYGDSIKPSPRIIEQVLSEFSIHDCNRILQRFPLIINGKKQDIIIQKVSYEQYILVYKVENNYSKIQQIDWNNISCHIPSVPEVMYLLHCIYDDKNNCLNEEVIKNEKCNSYS